MRSIVAAEGLDLSYAINRLHFVGTKPIARKQSEVIETTIAIFIGGKEERVHVTSERIAALILARENIRSPAHSVDFGVSSQDPHQHAPC